MEINEFQKQGVDTCMKPQIKGSHFVGEYYDFEKSHDKLSLFVDMLKNRGCYIADDGHIRSKKGGLMSKLMRNGYWLTMAAYNRKDYYFCEHRVVWVWVNGPIPENMEINHIDYNRGNNHIENLELVTHSENIQHSRPNFNPCLGKRSRRAMFTDRQAKAIKTIGVICGWGPKQIASLLNDPKIKEYNISRILNGKRYPHIEPGDILEAYPIIVQYTQNTQIGPDEEVKNYALGLCGEVGEFVDAMKKKYYHCKDINPSEVMLELGDILYYLCALCNVLGFDLYEIALNNNAKLMARYPDGFSVDASNNRIEDAEHKDIQGSPAARRDHRRGRQ